MACSRGFEGRSGLPTRLRRVCGGPRNCGWDSKNPPADQYHVRPTHGVNQWVLPSFVTKRDLTLRFPALPFPLMLGLVCVHVITYPGRWMAMRTSNFPVWPKEATCQIEPGDLYAQCAGQSRRNALNRSLGTTRRPAWRKREGMIGCGA